MLCRHNLIRKRRATDLRFLYIFTFIFFRKAARQAVIPNSYTEFSFLFNSFEKDIKKGTAIIAETAFEIG